jgi:hypothetical protein
MYHFSSMMESHALVHPTQNMNCPFIQYIHAVYTTCILDKVIKLTVVISHKTLILFNNGPKEHK